MIETVNAINIPAANSTEAQQAAPQETTEEKAPAAEAKPEEAKPESKAAKAAQESKRLRAAKAEAAKMKAELQEAKGKAADAEKLSKVQELLASNPKEALKLLGADPHKAYQALTENFLAKDIDLQPKDPVSEKLKEIDPYLATLKEREQRLAAQENQNAIDRMISTNVLPAVLSDKTALECLFGYFDPDGKNAPEQVAQMVAKNVFENAEKLFQKQFQGTEQEKHQQLIKKYGNYSAFFKEVAERLEKQVEQQLDQMVQRVQKLSKFKAKFQSQDIPKETVKSSSPAQATQGFVEEEDRASKASQEPYHLPSISSNIPRTSNLDRRASVDAWLKEKNLL
jgi:hypothetical protein